MPYRILTPDSHGDETMQIAYDMLPGGFELVAAFLCESSLCAGRDEHSDPPFLVENSVVNEEVDALARRGGVDPVERRELVGGRSLAFFEQVAGEDVVLDGFRDLQEDGTRVIHPDLPVIASLVHYSCN